MRTAFFNTIVCLHIGRLTNQPVGEGRLSAFDLRDEPSRSDRGPLLCRRPLLLGHCAHGLEQRAAVKQRAGVDLHLARAAADDLLVAHPQ